MSYLANRNVSIFNSTLTTSTLNTSIMTYSTMTGSSVTVSSITAPAILGTVTLGQNTTYPNRYVEMGTDTANSMYLDFHSNDSALPDYSTRIQSFGGATTGAGVMNLYGSTIGIMAPAGVGIGKSTPGYALDVAGTVNISGSYYVNGAPISLGSQWTTSGSIIYYSGGNVGIGTATPGTAFTVYTSSHGIRQTDGTTAIEMYISSGATPAGWLGTFSNHPLHFFTNNGNQQMTLLQNGNVGIGTITPSYTLDVVGTARCTGNLSAGNGTGAVGLNLYDLAAAAWQITTGSYNLSINNNSASWTNRVTILQNGNFGIGTNNPSSLLHVNGNAYVSGTMYSPTFSGSLYMADSAAYQTVGAQIINSSSGTAKTYQFNVSGNAGWGTVGTLGIYNGPAGKFSLCISPTSNVGIGTTDPGEQLTVYSVVPQISLRYSTTGWFNIGLATAAGNFSSSAAVGDSVIRAISGNLLLQSGGNAAAMIINTSNNVGIGTNSPSTTFQVNGKSTFIGQDPGSTQSENIFFNVTAVDSFNGNGGATIYSNSINLHAGDLYWAGGNRVYGAQIFIQGGVSPNGGNTPGAITMSTGGSAKMTVASNGYVGIGTNNPSYALHVVGTIYATSDIIGLSDRRYKENIVPLSDSLAKLQQLNGYTYHLKDEKEPRSHMGLLAQEVESVYPEAVYYDAEKDTYGLNYNAMVAPMIESIKELSVENKSLKEQLASLMKWAITQGYSS